MGRTIRTLVAVLVGLALVAVPPAPCGCVPERSAPGRTDAHACCTPPAGVRVADRGCCDESAAIAVAAPPPVGPATAPVLVAALHVEAPYALLVPALPAVTPAFSPPPAVLRI